MKFVKVSVKTNSACANGAVNYISFETSEKDLFVWSNFKGGWLQPTAYDINTFVIRGQTYTGGFGVNSVTVMSIEEANKLLRDTKYRFLSELEKLKIITRLEHFLPRSTKKSTTDLEINRKVNTDSASYIISVIGGTGTFSPAASPVIYNSYEEALEKANRLADLHRDSEFFILKTVASVLTPASPKSITKNFK